MPFNNSAFKTRRQSRLFEFLVVVIVISFVLLVAVSRYTHVGMETKRLGFELLAHNFTTSVANARAQHLIHRSQHQLATDEERLFFTVTGWPVSVRPDVIDVARDLTVQDCLQLWQNLLQNALPASVEGSDDRGRRRYHVSLARPGVCRYEMVSDIPDAYHFDYTPMTGQVRIAVPENKKNPT